MNPKSHQQRLAEMNQLIASQQASMMPQSADTTSDPTQPTSNDLTLNNLQTAGNIGQQMNPLMLYKQSLSGISPLGQKPQGMSDAEWVNMCERYAELATTGKTGQFATAADAANHYMQTGQMNPDVTKAPPGSITYFAPDAGNGYMGHAAVVNKDRSLTMSANAGIQTFPSVQAWLKYSGQRPLGFVQVKK